MSTNPAPIGNKPPPNPVKVKLAAGQPVIGAIISVNSPEIAAHIAGLGYDFLWIEMEHSPIDHQGLRNMVLATRGLPAIPFARPPVNELWTAKLILDMGALGVIFPFTRTGELARQAVAACRYPPLGGRGSGASLARLRWPHGAGYYDFADENVVVVTVVEDTCGVDNIEEIAATPGLDVIFIGTSDLSFSLGLRGEQNHPKLDAAIAKVLAAAKKHGKFVGRPALTAAQIAEFSRQGFQFFMTCTELELIAAGAAELLRLLV